MSFFDSVVSLQEKQLRINLSKRAYSVIESDITQFNIDMRETIFKPSNFICRIFINSRHKLNSFVSNRVEQVFHDYSSFIEPADKISKTITPEQSDQINQFIVDKLQRQIIQESENYIKTLLDSKRNSLIIYLNKEMLSFLSQIDLKIEEKIYKDKLSRFVKSVLEEYSLLPYYERERIIFKKNIDTLLTMCDFNKNEKNYYSAVQVLNNRNEKDISYHVIPFHCECDITMNYNYLLCYARAEGFDDYRVMKLRISHIHILPDTKETIRMKVPKEDSDTLNDWIKNGFAMYAGIPQRIKVLLTRKGENLFAVIRHNRPILKRKEGNIYEFECTEFEAENYFTAFTGDAFIIEPLSLRERLQKKYQSAVEFYSNAMELIDK